MSAVLVAALVLVVGPLLGKSITELQKYEFNRMRPAEDPHLVVVHSLSFPSGHSANAMMTYVALALFLFASLRTVTTTLNAGSEVSSASRMIVQNATTFVIPLPMSYAARLKSVPHVESVTWANWFGGKYGDGKKFFAQFAIDAESYLAMYPEIQIPDDQKQAFMRERSAAVIGEGLVRMFG